MSHLQLLEEDKNILLGFLQDSSLRSITSGTAASREVTTDRAKVGCNSFRNMERQNEADHPKKGTCSDNVAQSFCLS